MKLVAVTVIALMLVLTPGHRHRHRQLNAANTVTFAAVASGATATLLRVYYSGNGTWFSCDLACPTGNVDWGYDSLTYVLALRAALAHDPAPLPVLRALEATARTYPPPCQQLSACRYWSDTPEWDAIALADEYQQTGDPEALAKAQAAFAYVRQAPVFSAGACPAIPYQKPGGGSSHLKTLETEANAVKAALLLYRITHDRAYLADAVSGYAAARTYFLDSQVPLYSVYVFDDGQGCTQLPHRFFASVNGDMIWSGVELYHDTGVRAYLTQAAATGAAVGRYLADDRGVFADLQAENDIVEPLVEGMSALAARGERFARHWLLVNAAAAMSARTPDGSYGRFFDGPPPIGAVTAWQTNGGLAVEIAAAALAPTMVPRSIHAWDAEVYVARQVTGLPSTLSFRGSGLALLGTLGEHCCERGHALVLIDGRQTFDWSGIWQNKSSIGRSVPDTILFAWRWPTAGPHTLTLLPASPNAKEGGPFLHLVGSEVLGQRR